MLVKNWNLSVFRIFHMLSVEFYDRHFWRLKWRHNGETALDCKLFQIILQHFLILFGAVINHTPRGSFFYHAKHTKLLRPTARPSIMFFRGSRKMFAFLSVCIIRVSDVQICEDPNKKLWRPSIYNVLQELLRNVCCSLCMYNKSLWCSDLRGPQEEVTKHLQHYPS